MIRIERKREKTIDVLSKMLCCVMALLLLVMHFPEFVYATGEGEEASLQEQSGQALPEVQRAMSDPVMQAIMNLPFGGATLQAGHTGSVVVMEIPDGDGDDYYEDYNANAPGQFSNALTDLANYSVNDPGSSFVLYIGAEIGGGDGNNIPAGCFNSGAGGGLFADLIYVDTLLITGHQDDTPSITPVITNPGTSVRSFQNPAAASAAYFGCNIVLRNLRHNLGANVYMKGHDLVLAGNTWQMSATNYYGGSNTAAATVTQPDAVDIDVYSTGSGESSFYGGMNVATGTMIADSNITIHNTSNNMVSVYGGGNSGNMTGNTAVTVNDTGNGILRVYGGGNSGTVTGNTAVTINDTGVTGATETTVVGGMNTGTLTGNTNTLINNTGGGNLSVYGGGRNANVVGNVTTTITGMNGAADTNGDGITDTISVNTGGLNTYIGGLESGNIIGRVTNTIIGAGRFVGGEGSGADYFVLGSLGGNIGDGYTGDTNGNGAEDAGETFVFAAPEDPSATVGTGPDDASQTPLNSYLETSPGKNALIDYGGVAGQSYAIKSNIDTSAYSIGRKYYVGANASSGFVAGNVINILKAGENNKGSYTGVQCGGGASTGTVSIAGFSGNSATGKVTGDIAGRVNAEGSAKFRIYGNITSIIREGSVSTGADTGYFRGAGYGGYVKGNAYAVVGTEGTVYLSGNKSYSYSHSNVNNAGAFDLVGGGGVVGVDNSICIDGNTTLVTVEVHARWTYGANFDGVLVGNSYRIHKGGVVDTCEGAGFNGAFNVGNAHAEVYGGQVNWFLSGGGWNDTYIDGNVSVVVHDSPISGHPVIINASMGGTYGDSLTHYVSGDSYMLVYGGDFSGAARDVPYQGFSGGPSDNGYIFGNSTVTVDLRGNENGFDIGTSGDNISGGRRLGAFGTIHLGTNADNTVTLNIFADEDTASMLNGLNIYGDAPSETTASHFGHITMNINAPGAQFGGLYATRYMNLMGTYNSGTLWQQYDTRELLKDVEINLVSAASVNGLSCGNGFGTSTSYENSLNNWVAARSAAAGKGAVINIGPQPDDPAEVPPLTVMKGITYSGQGTENYLSDGFVEHTTVNNTGLPEVIKVLNQSDTALVSGVNGFTEMTVRERLLSVENASGAIKNGGRRTTLANHGVGDANNGRENNRYDKTGHVTLYAGEGVNASGLGIGSEITATEVFIAGNLKVEGSGKVYIQSRGLKNQVIFSKAAPGSAVVSWLKVGTQASQDWSAPQSTWFGLLKGWYVFTLDPDGTDAAEMTPFNLEGIDYLTRETYIGDNIPKNGPTTPDSRGYAVCIAGSVYTWKVTDQNDNYMDGTSPYDQDGSPEKGGKIAHNVGNVWDGTGIRPAVVNAVGNTAAGEFAYTGRLAIPNDKIPGDFEFTFRPDGADWRFNKYLINRSDRFLDPLPPGSVIRKDYDPNDVKSDYVWLVPEDYHGTPGATYSHGGNPYTVDIIADFAQEPRVLARDVILYEWEAMALSDGVICGGTLGADGSNPDNSLSGYMAVDLPTAYDPGNSGSFSCTIDLPSATWQDIINGIDEGEAYEIFRSIVFSVDIGEDAEEPIISAPVNLIIIKNDRQKEDALIDEEGGTGKAKHDANIIRHNPEAGEDFDPYKDRQYAVYAEDAEMTLEQAQGLADKDALDVFTNAFGVKASGETGNIVTGELVVLAKNEDGGARSHEPFDDITETNVSTSDTIEDLDPDKKVPVKYLYTTDPDDPAQDNDSYLPPAVVKVTVTILPTGVDFTFYKINQEEAPLVGVHFVLYKNIADDPNDPPEWEEVPSMTYISGQDDENDDTEPYDSAEDLGIKGAEVEFKALTAGQYKLEETKTLPGYEFPAGYWIITVDPSEEIYVDRFTFTAAGSPMAFGVDKNGTDADTSDDFYTLINYPEFVMPLSGGKGAIPFTIGGIVLIGLAVILTVLFKKKSDKPTKAAKAAIVEYLNSHKL
ncbi:MAG TPA: hypothetical protein DEQ02_08625 [Ruminococcaceae bacterium]|nr:hypothetical protein [Oscillospiraceae bacterium]